MNAGRASHIVRKAVEAHVGYKAGMTTEEAKRRYGLSEIIKLSSNENPLGASPLAERALREIDALSVYVDNDYRELRDALASYVDVDVDDVIVGHGSNELLALTFSAFVERGDTVVAATPTFSLYGADVAMRDASLLEVPLRDGVHDLHAMARAVQSGAKAVVICDPNNPTSTRVDAEAMHRFSAALPADTLLIIDQAYREYMPAGSLDGIAIARDRPNTLVYRTLSKAFGLASLRLGYAVGSPDCIEYMQRIRLPFNVTRTAVVAGLAALRDTAFLARTITTNAVERDYLLRAFEQLGIFIYPSAANFVAIRTPIAAIEVAQALLERGIAVRAGFEDEALVRITVGTHEDNRTLMTAFEAIAPLWSTTVV